MPGGNRALSTGAARCAVAAPGTEHESTTTPARSFGLPARMLSQAVPKPRGSGAVRWGL